MQIKVDADIQQAQKYLRRVGERNIPLAVAQSLTATAKHLRNVQSRSMTKHFDRPVKFTQNAFRLKIAKAREFKSGVMSSAIIAKDIQQQYLSFQVDGGTRRPKSGQSSFPVQTQGLTDLATCRANICGRNLQNQMCLAARSAT